MAVSDDNKQDQSKIKGDWKKKTQLSELPTQNKPVDDRQSTDKTQKPLSIEIGPFFS